MKRFDDIKRYYLFSALVKRFIVPIIVVHMLLQGIRIDQVAMIAAIGYILAIIFEAPSGAIADTLGHRRSLVIALVGSAISVACYFGGTYAWFLAATCLFQISGSLYSGTKEALFYERLKELGRLDEHQKLSGRARAWAQGIGIAFMIGAGITYQVAWWLPFAINIAEFLFGAYIIAGFTEAKKPVSVKKEEGYWEVYTHLVRATKDVWRIRPVFWISAIFFILTGVGMATIEFHQVLLVSAAVAPAAIGVVYAAKRFSGMLGSLFTHRITKYIRPQTYLLCAPIGYALGLTLAMFSNTVVGLLVAFSLLSFVFHSFVVAVNDYVNRCIGSLSRATTLSVMMLYRSIFSTALIFVIGYYSNILSMHTIFGLSGLLTIGLTVITAPALFRSLAKNKSM